MTILTIEKSIVPRQLVSVDFEHGKLQAQLSDGNFRIFNLSKSEIVEQLRRPSEMKQYIETYFIEGVEFNGYNFNLAFSEITKHEIEQFVAGLFQKIIDGKLEYETQLIDKYGCEVEE